jgi:hypothetical protein
MRNSASGSGSDLSGYDRRDPNRCLISARGGAGQRPWDGGCCKGGAGWEFVKDFTSFGRLGLLVTALGRPD